MNTQVLLNKFGETPDFGAARLKPQSVHQQEMVANNLHSRAKELPQNIYKMSVHHRPKQIKDVLFTPRFALGDYACGDPYPSNGWQLDYHCKDPITGQTVIRKGSAWGGQFEGV